MTLKEMFMKDEPIVKKRLLKEGKGNNKAKKISTNMFHLYEERGKDPVAVLTKTPLEIDDSNGKYWATQYYDFEAKIKEILLYEYETESYPSMNTTDVIFGNPKTIKSSNVMLYVIDTKGNVFKETIVFDGTLKQAERELKNRKRVFLTYFGKENDLKEILSENIGEVKKGDFHKWAIQKGYIKSMKDEIPCKAICDGLKDRDPHVRKMANFARNFGHPECKCR